MDGATRRQRTRNDGSRRPARILDRSEIASGAPNAHTEVRHRPTNNAAAHNDAPHGLPASSNMLRTGVMDAPLARAGFNSPDLRWASSLLRRYTNQRTTGSQMDHLDSPPDPTSLFATPWTVFAGQMRLLIPRWRDRDSHGPLHRSQTEIRPDLIEAPQRCRALARPRPHSACGFSPRAGRAASSARRPQR